jgi:hypothetical protein
LKPIFFVKWAEMPRSPGHISCDRLQKLLSAAGFGAFVKETCKSLVGPNFKTNA